MRSLCTMLIAVIWTSISVFGQGWGRVEGHVTDFLSGSGLSGVTILVAGTDFGTATSLDGTFSLRLPAGTFRLQASMIGYELRADSVFIERDLTAILHLVLKPSVTPIDEIMVTGSAPHEAGMHALSPETIRNIPGPFKDGFRALKVLPGVVSNNETSNEYSVRGGGYNENLLFLDGFEVFKPFRTRQGEQEGLGLLNPEMTKRVTLYTGGFPVKYGGKLSSALDVEYRQASDTPITGSGYVSNMDGGVSLSGSTSKNRFSWNVGVREARTRSFFASQELKGEYDPEYTDAQAVATYRVSKRIELGLIALWANHTFRLDPSERRTYFGTYQDLRSAWFNYSGSEIDGYTTTLGGLRLSHSISNELSAEYRVARFQTVETEQYSVRGAANLYLVDPIETDPESPRNDVPIGGVTQEDIADNRVSVTTNSFLTKWTLTKSRVNWEAGLSGKQFVWNDRLFETSSVVGQGASGQLVKIELERLEGTLEPFRSTQAGAFVQSAFNLTAIPGNWIATTGIRADYFDFNNQLTLSPRITLQNRTNDRLTLAFSGGLYYQAPTYRELRGEPEVGDVLSEKLNTSLQAQRSLQFVGSGEYFVPKTRLYFRGELFYKKLDQLISYDVRNTRLTYSGQNDSFGYAYGTELQLRGEFVPGLESWFNYSFLVSRENFLDEFTTPYNTGWRPRPMEQRHTVSMYVQDYLPSNPEWKLHMRLLYGSGLPFTPPVPGEEINSVTLQEPGQRHSQRYLSYKRVDMGVSRTFRISQRSATRNNTPPVLQLSAEMLNVFDSINTIAYSWIAGADGIWQRIPTRLTPRLATFRIRFEF